MAAHAKIHLRTGRRHWIRLIIVLLAVVGIIFVALLMALRQPARRQVTVGGIGPSPLPSVQPSATPSPTDAFVTPTTPPETSTPEVIVKVATPTPVVIDRGGLISQIQEEMRLETEIFLGERVVEASRLQGNWQDILSGEQLLLIASGKVIAGVDFQKIKAEDVIVSSDGLSITLRLPPTEILVNTLDNQRTRVYSDQRGLFANNPDLETAARQQGEREILKAACDLGIMDKAARTAKRDMTGFLRTLKFEHVDIQVVAGSCIAPPSSPEPTIVPAGSAP